MWDITEVVLSLGREKLAFAQQGSGVRSVVPRLAIAF